jgi:hypothetical protein
MDKQGGAGDCRGASRLLAHPRRNQGESTVGLDDLAAAETRLDRRIDKLDGKLDRVDTKLTKFEEREIDKLLQLKIAG